MHLIDHFANSETTVAAFAPAVIMAVSAITAWLKALRSTTLHTEQEGSSGTIKTDIKGISPRVAERIVKSLHHD